MTVTKRRLAVLSAGIAVLCFGMLMTRPVAAEGGVPKDFHKNLWVCLHLIDYHKENHIEGEVWNLDALKSLRQQVLIGLYPARFSQSNSKNLAGLAKAVDKLGAAYAEAAVYWAAQGLPLLADNPGARDRALSGCYVRSFAKLSAYMASVVGENNQRRLPGAYHVHEKPFDGP